MRLLHHDPLADRDLERRVQQFLAERYFSSLRSLSVDAADGQVVISGRVNTFHEKQVALNSCRRVAGVRSLVDQMSVVDE